MAFRIAENLFYTSRSTVKMIYTAMHFFNLPVFDFPLQVKGERKAIIF
jgi:hypothetical protein